MKSVKSYPNFKIVIGEFSVMWNLTLGIIVGSKVNNSLSQLFT
jgi:hypothetical protein